MRLLKEIADEEAVSLEQSRLICVAENRESNSKHHISVAQHTDRVRAAEPETCIVDAGRQRSADRLVKAETTRQTAWDSLFKDPADNATILQLGPRPYPAGINSTVGYTERTWIY